MLQLSDLFQSISLCDNCSVFVNKENQIEKKIEKLFKLPINTNMMWLLS
jgi:hypothetical protein